MTTPRGRRHTIGRSFVGARRFIWPFVHMQVDDYVDLFDGYRDFVTTREAQQRVSSAAIRVGRPRGWRFSCSILSNGTTIRCRRIL